MKTSIDIERDFYGVINSSLLANEINGSVLRAEERDDDATTEDATVKFLTGQDGDIQRGVVIVNVYITDIPSKSGRMIANKPRIGELMRLMMGLPSLFNGTGYLVNSVGDERETPHYMKIEDIDQHCIVQRLNYRILNQD